MLTEKPRWEKQSPVVYTHREKPPSIVYTKIDPNLIILQFFKLLGGWASGTRPPSYTPRIMVYTNEREKNYHRHRAWAQGWLPMLALRTCGAQTMATLFGSTITVFARFMPLTHALSLPMEIHGVLQMADLPDIRCWYKTDIHIATGLQ